ncbi:MAG TPA: DUF2231 domain-containing protein [Candidatus Binatia bacterium]|nr:DUF2231 domain-containing protein [Candidatus Binatia bacterium]
MARLFSIKPGITLKGREFRGLRGWAGKPTHPPLTDFPIVCYVLAAVFDVISCYKARGGGAAARDFFVAGTYVIVAGAIVSLGTALTGFWDWWKGMAKHTQVWRTANWHMTVMLTVTAIVVIDIVVRLRRFGEGSADGLTTILSVLAALLVSYGATYGGSMVFDYQFNVESLEGKTVWDETEADQNPGEHLPPKK